MSHLLIEHKSFMDALYKTSCRDDAIDLWAASFGAGELSVLISNERYADPTRRALEEGIWLRIVQPHMRVLDCGSGTGYFIKRIQETVGKDVVCVGIDLSSVALGLALERLGRDALLTLGAGECLPFPDKTFDVVFGIAVFEHVLSPTAVVNELTRVLKPGGYLYVVVHKPFIDPLVVPSLLMRSYLLARRVGRLMLESFGVRDRRRSAFRYNLPVNYVRVAVRDALEKNALILVEKRALIYAFEWDFYGHFSLSLAPHLLKVGRWLNRLPFTYYKNLEYWLFRRPW